MNMLKLWSLAINYNSFYLNFKSGIIWTPEIPIAAKYQNGTNVLILPEKVFKHTRKDTWICKLWKPSLEDGNQSNGISSDEGMCTWNLTGPRILTEEEYFELVS